MRKSLLAERIFKTSGFFLAHLIIQLFFLLPAHASDIKNCLKVYEETAANKLKERQERLQSLIFELKMVSKKVARVAPPLIDLLRTLLYLQLSREDGKGALDTCNYIAENINTLCPKEDEAQSILDLTRLERCKAYLILRRPDEAVDELVAYRRNHPPLANSNFYDADLDFLESQAKFQQGDARTSRELINKIIKNTSTNTHGTLLSRVCTLASEISASQGNHEAALDEANRALNLPNNLASSSTFLERALAHVAKSNALTGCKRFEQAVADAQKAIELNPDLKSAYLALAKAYKEMKEIEKSMEAIDKCLAIDSGLATAVALRKELNEIRIASSAAATSQNQQTPYSAAPSFPVEKSPIRDKWALVIGISKFQNPNLNLKFADKDAQDFKDYLVKEGNFSSDHVRLLLNENASREEILKILGDSWLPRVVLPNDLVVIYLSTHGSPSSFDVKGVNYLLAHDTKVDSLYATGIAIQDLARIIKGRINTNRIVMILDACHSGSAEVAGSKGLVRAANIDAAALLQGAGQIVIASSDVDQRSWEFKNKTNGVFTYFLIDSLRKAGSYGNLFEAFNAMKEQVQTEVLKERGVLQVPILKSKWSAGELNLAVPPAKPRQGI